LHKEIKLVDIQAQYNEIRDELHKTWDEVFLKMHLMLGPHMSAFENEFAQYSGTRFGVGVGSGTAALHLGLLALGVLPDEEVIVPSFTFFATVEAVAHCGAVPVMLDVDRESATLSVAGVKEFISENCRLRDNKLFNKVTGRRVRAMIPVHLYGMPARMDELMRIARENGLQVLEDCAQAHGAEFNGRKIGSFGDASAYSFYFSKNLSALGEGGIVLTQREDVKDAVQKLRLHGQTDKYTHGQIGFNSRLDEMQAVVLRLKLTHLDRWNQRRIELAKRYDKALQGLPVVPFAAEPGRDPVYHLYVIQTAKRDQLAEFLRNRQIGVGIHYPIPCHLQPGVRHLGYREGDLPVSERLATEVLSLPMHPHLQDSEVDQVAQAVQDFFQE
jgi:dTDP-4-amino-4,6-dideoxygalactose transaminase